MKRSSLRLAGAALAASALLLSACGDGGSDTDGTDGPGAGGEEQQTYSIGIMQIAAHPSLDASREGFKADRKSTRLNSSHVAISYAVFCLKKKKSNRAR